MYILYIHETAQTSNTRGRLLWTNEFTASEATKYHATRPPPPKMNSNQPVSVAIFCSISRHHIAQLVIKVTYLWNILFSQSVP